MLVFGELINGWYIMNNCPCFAVFSILKQLPERIITKAGAPIDGAEHIKVTINQVDVDSEFWIGRFSIDVKISKGVDDDSVF